MISIAGQKVKDRTINHQARLDPVTMLFFGNFLIPPITFIQFCIAYSFSITLFLSIDMRQSAFRRACFTPFVSENIRILIMLKDASGFRLKLYQPREVCMVRYGSLGRPNRQVFFVLQNCFVLQYEFVITT